MSRNEALWLLGFLAAWLALASRGMVMSAMLAIIFALPVLLLLDALESLAHWLSKRFFQAAQFFIRRDPLFGRFLVDETDEEIPSVKIWVWISYWLIAQIALFLCTTVALDIYHRYFG